jgi:hypothetical protein
VQVDDVHLSRKLRFHCPHKGGLADALRTGHDNAVKIVIAKDRNDGGLEVLPD